MNRPICPRNDFIDHPRPRDRLPPRGGYSMLELVVALAVLGIALAGLFPLAVQYSRQVKKLEGCNPQTGRWQYANNNWTYRSDSLGQYPDQWYLNRSADTWAQKLGASAALATSPLSAPLTPLPSYDPTTNTILADNSTAGYYSETDSANWLDGPTAGYLGNSRRHSAGTVGMPASGDYATWTFNNLPPGWYIVEATWPDPSVGPFPQTDGVDQSPTSSACYSIYDNDANGVQEQLWQYFYDQTMVLNQANQTACNLDSFAGVYWMPIKTVYVHKQTVGTANTVEVRLMSQAQWPVGTFQFGFTTADAVRLVPIGNTLTPTLAQSSGGQTAGGTVSVSPLQPRP